MRAGFTFKNKHSGDFGATVSTESRPILPETKAQTYDAPLADGEYDFSEANIYRRRFYKSRTFKVNIGVLEGTLTDLQKKLEKLAAWLTGKGDLIFDDTPSVIWDARVDDLIEYKPEKGGKSALLSVTFTASAFTRLVFNVIDGPRLGDAIELASDIPLDISTYFIFTGSGSFTAYNIGNAPVRPVITVTGTKDNTLTLTFDNAVLTLKIPSTGTAVIDCEKQTATDGSGNSIMANFTGTFPELLPGANAFSVENAETTQISYEPRYFYNADLDEVNLG